MRFLTLILLSVTGVCADSHSLRYYFTGVSAPGSGLPEYSVVGYVDDQKAEIYTSDLGKRVPVATWMKENVRPEQWDITTQRDKGEEALFRYEVKLLMKRFNHTGGFHFMQVMTMYILHDDGSTEGYKQYSYDGREYMYFDTKTGKCIHTMAEAQMITQRWNSPDVGLAEYVRNHMDYIVNDKLKRYIEYGRQDLERRVLPRVKVTGRESGEVTKLHCLVYGFHPRAVEVKWIKNGTDEIPSYETTHVLPNPDGTYQIRVAVEVIPQEGDSYYCYVDHSSLEEPLLVEWEPTQGSHLAVIIGVVFIVLVLTSVTVGVIIYKKKKENYTATSTSDPSSDNNQTATAEMSL